MHIIDIEKEKKVALIKLLTRSGYTDQEIKDFYYRREVRLNKKNKSKWVKETKSKRML